jgi:hypothetical protein
MNLDNDLRVIWEFTLGIPISSISNKSIENDEQDEQDKQDEQDEQDEQYKQQFKHLIFEITEELTRISKELTYEYCYGTWCQGVAPSFLIERDLSVRISIIVLPEISEDFYKSAKSIISIANTKYDLGMVHVQAMKSFGYAKHFVV